MCCQPSVLYHRISGFTFIELLVCLIIAAFIFFGGMSLRQSLQKNRVETVSRSLQNALHFSRNLALARGETLILRPISNRNNWSEGMMLFSDKTVLQEWHWNSPDINIQWQGFASSNYVVFSPDPAHASSSGSFHIFDQQGVKKIIITINRIGHIRHDSTLASFPVSRIPAAKTFIMARVCLSKR